MTTTALPPNEWAEDDVDFLLNNASYFSFERIGQFLGKSTHLVERQAKALGVSRKDSKDRKELPPVISDLECIPLGTTNWRTRTGTTVWRIPTSTPGIPTRTVHTAWDVDEMRPDAA